MSVFTYTLSVKRYIYFLLPILFSLRISAQPVIHSFSPLSARVGETVTISGTNFDPAASGNIVYFGAVKATVTASSPTLLSVKVPAGASYQPVSVTTGHLTAWSPALFTTTFTGLSSDQDYSYVEPAGNFTTGLHPNGVVIADFDGDGKPDLATPNNYSIAGTTATVSVLRNTSTLYSISFAPEIDYASGSLTYSLAAADIDGDGLQDLIATSITDKTVSILRNTSTPGAISFAGKVSFSTGDNPYSVAVGDFNADGKPDLAVANYLSNSISIFKNKGTTGNISFEAKADITSGLMPGSLIVNDIDGDNKVDIAVVNELSNSLSVFRNSSTAGNISFANGVAFTTAAGPKAVTAGDFDNDGKIDLVVSNNSDNTELVSLFRNTSTAGSISMVANPPGFKDGNHAFKSAVGDFNGDGKADIITPVNASAYVQFNGSSTNTIAFPTSYNIPSTNPYNAAMGDLDGDGKIDLVVPSFINDYLQVFRNHVGEPNISGISPGEGTSGATITIYGYRFSGITGVSFGGVPAASFTVNSANVITAVIGAGATGDVVVTAANGKSTLTNGFTWQPPPIIESFSPTTGIAGTKVTIRGRNLGYNSPSAVSFGGVPATLYRFEDTLIQAIVGDGASGDVVVTTSYGSDTAHGFTFVPPPTITAFSPASGGTGMMITITGTDLTGATAVNIGETPAASFTVVSPTTVTAYVGGGSSGAVTITTPAGTDTIDGFTFNYVPSPVITAFSPEKGKAGITVTLTGNNFNTTPAGNIVYFGATRATVLTASATQLTVKVPSGATFEPISVLHTGNHLTAFSRKPFIIADTTVGYPVTENTFSGYSNVGNPTSPTNLLAKDMNGDGKPDLLTSSLDRLNILYNASVNPAITIGSISEYSNVGVTVNTRLALGDLDGDGLTDIVRPSNNSTLFVYRNTGTSASCSFNTTLTFSPFGDLQDAAIGDIDGDGRPDIVVAEYYLPGSISILRNTSIPGTISFASPIRIATGSAASRIAIGDIDNDGLADVVAGCESNIAVFKNTSTAGNISFRTQVDLRDVPGNSKVVIADLDNDNRLDLVASSATTLGIYKNTGQPGTVSFSYVAERSLPLAFLPDMNVADINLDGKPDIVTSNDATISVYENTSSGGTITTASPVAFGSNSSLYKITLADMDADGKTDILSDHIDRNLIDAMHNQADVPYIRYFSPTEAAQGDTIIINGANLAGVTGIQLGGTAAASFTINADTSITAVVSNGTSGSITATSAKGTGSKDRFTFIPPLSITSFSPVDGGAGTTITITGDGFRNITGITIGGVPVASIEGYVMSSIAAIVGTGASGDVVIMTAKDTVRMAGFTYYQRPVITGFTPDTAIADNEVTIMGTHFTGATAVTFGGIPVDSFTVHSDFRITAVIKTAASGEVSVITPGGTATLAGFTFIPAPVITTRAPGGGTRGTLISLYGRNFSNATAVRYGGVPAQSFTVVSDQLITTVVGNGASGATEVEGPGGIGIMEFFEYAEPATVSSFTPTQAAAGAAVTITGNNFADIRQVTFGGTAAKSYTLLSPTSIMAIVDNGATGYVSVTGKGGTDSAAGFIYIPPAPEITDFTPAKAATGATVTITGRNFDGVSKVTFGGTAAQSYTLLSTTSISAVVNTGTTGYVSVTTAGGTDSAAGFIYLPPTPVIAAFTPAKAATGTAVTITGANFTGTTQVLFGGVAALSFTVVSADTIIAVVGPGASGALTVTTAEGSISSNGFIYLPGEQLTVYPNPAHDKFYVKHPASTMASHITLIDRMGRTMKVIEVPANTERTEVSVKGLALGVYEVIWTNGSNKLRQSLLVQ